jgi:MFS family permease
MLAGVVAYAVMSFIMTATPVSMHVVNGHSVDATASVIQAHVIAMFAPSLFSGVLIDRLGPRRMMVAGAVAMLACIAIASASQLFEAYAVSLALLGVGWNFLFVGGTVQLSRSWQPDERFRVQATNDLVVFGTQAIASLSAGAALHAFGWTAVNLIALPLLIVMLIALALTRSARTTARSQPASQPSIAAHSNAP